MAGARAAGGNSADSGRARRVCGKAGPPRCFAALGLAPKGDALREQHADEWGPALFGRGGGVLRRAAASLAATSWAAEQPRARARVCRQVYHQQARSAARLTSRRFSPRRVRRPRSRSAGMPLEHASPPAAVDAAGVSRRLPRQLEPLLAALACRCAGSSSSSTRSGCPFGALGTPPVPPGAARPRRHAPGAAHARTARRYAAQRRAAIARQLPVFVAGRRSPAMPSTTRHATHASSCRGCLPPPNKLPPFAPPALPPPHGRPRAERPRGARARRRGLLPEKAGK